MKKELYIFSGLGADERVFQRLIFSRDNTVFIKWIIPNKNESIEMYAKRIAEQISSKKPILLGLSFGGMMAIEVAKQIETEKVILISSVKTKNEIPVYYRFIGKTGLHKLLPSWIMKKTGFITNWFFGVNSNADKGLLQQIINDTNTQYLQWAINAIVCWNNEIVPKNILHIHGTNDKILPIRYVNCNIKINGGGHLMTLTMAEEFNKILATI